MGGFIGSSLEGVTTTLGSGGSDLAAWAPAVTRGGPIWTDVDGPC